MKSLEKALAILAAFTEDQKDFGVVELSEQLKMPRSQVSKILATLRDRQFLVQDPTNRRYGVGVQSFVLGAKFLSFDRLCHEAIPQLYKLVRATGHSARLSVVSNDRAIFLVAVEGPHLQDTGWRAGRWLPWHASSAARIMLAYFDEARTSRILDGIDFVPLTPQTTRSREELADRIRQARERGYDTQNGEISTGLCTISVPVFGACNQVVGAISLAFPHGTVSDGENASLIGALHEVARKVSVRMGNVVYGL